LYNTRRTVGLCSIKQNRELNRKSPDEETSAYLLYLRASATASN